MIGSDLESRVASWAASAISNDAAAVRAVIEAHGDRLAAADVAGVVSQYTGNAAVMQPELETVIGSQQLTATYAAAFENMRLDFTFRFDDITVKGDLAAVRATSQGAITIRPRYRRDATSASPAAVRSGTRGATGRSRSTCTSRCRSSQEGAAPASSESATPDPGTLRIRLRSPSTTRRLVVTLIYLPVQGPCRWTSARPEPSVCLLLGWPPPLAVAGSRPPHALRAT